MTYSVVVFSGDHCKPCRDLKEFLDTLGLEYSVMDVSQNHDLVEKYNVTQIPTCYFAKNCEGLSDAMNVFVGFGEDEKTVLREFATKLYNTSRPREVVDNFIPCV